MGQAGYSIIEIPILQGSEGLMVFPLQSLDPRQLHRRYTAAVRLDLTQGTKNFGLYPRGGVPDTSQGQEGDTSQYFNPGSSWNYVPRLLASADALFPLVKPPGSLFSPVFPASPTTRAPTAANGSPDQPPPTGRAANRSRPDAIPLGNPWRPGI